MGRSQTGPDAVAGKPAEILESEQQPTTPNENALFELRRIGGRRIQRAQFSDIPADFTNAIQVLGKGIDAIVFKGLCPPAGTRMDRYRRASAMYPDKHFDLRKMAGEAFQQAWSRGETPDLRICCEKYRQKIALRVFPY